MRTLLEQDALAVQSDLTRVRDEMFASVWHARRTPGATVDQRILDWAGALDYLLKFSVPNIVEKVS